MSGCTPSSNSPTSRSPKRWAKTARPSPISCDSSRFPAQVLTMLEQAQLSMGHARALLALEDVEAIRRLAADIVARQLSVRDTERAVRVLVMATPETTAPAIAPRTAAVERSIPPAVRQIQDALRRALQTDVSIQLSAKEKGSINIAFYSSDDLERVLELIVGRSWADAHEK